VHRPSRWPRRSFPHCTSRACRGASDGAPPVAGRQSSRPDHPRTVLHAIRGVRVSLTRPVRGLGWFGCRFVAGVQLDAGGSGKASFAHSPDEVACRVVPPALSSHRSGSPTRGMAARRVYGSCCRLHTCVRNRAERSIQVLLTADCERALPAQGWLKSPVGDAPMACFTSHAMQCSHAMRCSPKTTSCDEWVVQTAGSWRALVPTRTTQ